MSDELEIFLFSLTIAIPAIIALFRLKNADPAFYPFFIYIFLSLFNELLVGLYLVNQSKQALTVNWQLFNLAEWLILLVQFYYWGRFKERRALFFVVLFSSLGWWVFENLIYSNIYSFNPIFLIGYSFILVLLSINTIKYVITQHNSSLGRNALFIICVTFVIFFVYTIVVFTLLATNPISSQFSRKIFEIRVYVNALTNILYAIAVYYIPVKTAGINKPIFEELETRSI